MPCIQQGACAYVKIQWTKAPVIPQGYKIVYLLSAPNSKLINAYHEKPDFFLCKRGKYFCIS
ncbi:MAG: hypothetical protein IPO07_01125 [Haliscomenobacter sp.]|nr:hypothetical protein [Haliscomenobacter sp.]MBK9487530.1 hypothetical protein [Haliscomenobacter sp.]